MHHLFRLFILTTGTAAFSQTADTRFSSDRGFYTSAFSLEITSESPDAAIYYTTDGSLPTATNGILYSQPVSISRTTVIRAFAEAPGQPATNVDTHTYLFPADIVNQPRDISGYQRPNYATGGSGPTVSMDYEMDPAVTMDPAYTSDIFNAFAEIPSLCLSVAPEQIFGSGNFYDGSNIETQVSVEVLYPDDPSRNESAQAGVESHSHQRLKRSLRLNFRAEYGDAKWNTRLFRNTPFNPDNRSTPNQADRVILRAGNNRAWSRSFSREKTTYGIDEFARLTQQQMNGDGIRGAFTHLFINGIYWGLYNPVIRADTFYTSETYGGEESDWFAVSHGGDIKGNDDRYDYLRGGLKNKDMSVAENYQELTEHLDIDNFIDYLLVHWYTNTGDWPQNNWYGGLRNPSSSEGPLPMKFFAWDGEWSWDLPHGSIRSIAPDPEDTWVHPDFRANDGKQTSRVIANLFNSAKDNELFIRRLGDRAYQHLANGGALTDASSTARFTAITDYLRNPVVAESARWGDALDTNNDGSPLFTRDNQWTTEVADIISYIDGRAPKLITALRDEGYYPEIDPPTYQQHGGEITPGFELEISPPDPNTQGEIRYTLDGSDPAENGILYDSPILLTESTRVLARITDGDEWSAAADATFLLPDTLPVLVSELHYHPADPSNEEQLLGHTGSNDFEYLELHNPGSTPLDLSDYQFTSGITLTLPEGSVLPAGTSAVVVGDSSCFIQRHGTTPTILGDYRGKLSNDGERIALTSPLGQNIIDFTYNDTWQRRSDGQGYSLTLVEDLLSETDQTLWSLESSWIDSGILNGTPGALPPAQLDFVTWIQNHGLSIGPDDRDLDQDGYPDILEYAFGSNPLRQETSLVNITPEGITYNIRQDRIEVIVQTQFSSTLSQWSDVETTESIAPGFSSHHVSWPDEKNHFFRLSAQRQE